MKNIVKLLLILFVAASITSCNRIDAGHTGILFHHYGSKKGVSDTELVSGMVWYNPLTKSVYEYPHHYKTATFEDVTFNSSEGEGMTADIAVIYRYVKDEIPNLFDLFRLSPNELETTIIKQKVIDALNRDAGQIQAVSLAGKMKDSLLIFAENSLNEDMGEHFDFDQVSFATKIVPSETVQNSINAVISAQEAAKEAEAEIVREEAEKEKKRIQAEGNNLLSASLTDKVVQWEQIRIQWEELSLRKEEILNDKHRIDAWKETGGNVPDQVVTLGSDTDPVYMIK